MLKIPRNGSHFTFRDIAKGKGHLVCEFDLKRILSPEMGAILVSEIRCFALFSKSILVIPAKLHRDIARGKGHFVCEFDLKRL